MEGHEAVTLDDGVVDALQTLPAVGAGDETWRAVSVQFTRDAVWYATDAEFRPNRLFRLDRASGRRREIEADDILAALREFAHDAPADEAVAAGDHC